MGISLGIAGLVGAGVNAYGTYEAGQAASKNAAYQAAVAANNATIAQRNARTDIQAGETAATNEGLKTRAAVGTEKANQGASGVDVNSGSAPAVRAGTQEVGLLDALTLRSDAAKRSYGQEVTATSETAQSGLETAESGQAATAGDIGAGGSLLSGVSTVGRNYVAMQNAAGSNPSTYGPLAGIGMANMGSFGFTGD
jgi:hypothetical protein